MKYPHGKPGQKGFTLLEALVAVLVLSIGVLSLAYMVLASQRSNDDAVMRATAIVLGNAILDNMRANLADATLGSTSQYSTAQVSQYSGTANCVGTTACSASSLASSDVASWKTLLQNNLPQSDGAITITKNGSYTIATVTVYWDAQRSSASTPAAGSLQLATAGCTTLPNNSSPCLLTVTLQSVLQ